jgi:hypothetical protein
MRYRIPATRVSMEEMDDWLELRRQHALLLKVLMTDAEQEDP